MAAAASGVARRRSDAAIKFGDKPWRTVIGVVREHQRRHRRRASESARLRAVLVGAGPRHGDHDQHRSQSRDAGAGRPRRGARRGSRPAARGPDDDGGDVPGAVGAGAVRGAADERVCRSSRSRWPASGSTASPPTASAAGCARSASAWRSAARRRDVVRLILGSAWRMIAPGLLLGHRRGLRRARARWKGSCSARARPIRSCSAPVVVTLALMASLASYLPARRAAQVDPIVVLRIQ